MIIDALCRPSVYPPLKAKLFGAAGMADWKEGLVAATLRIVAGGGCEDPPSPDEQ